MSHVLGYIGQISEAELKTPVFANYAATDWVGKSGIEEQYEQLLRGVDGKQLIEIDALGKKVRSLGQTDPIAGVDITLTLDTKVQKAAYDGAKSVHKGAIVVSKPDGQILAMVSKPSFDPNLFTLDTTYKPASDSAYFSLESVLEDSNSQPLLDRVIAGTYPPGSTFKLVTAASGLDKHVIDDSYRVTDTGVVKIGQFSFANWFYTQYGKTEPGELDVTRALARSNDIFFYKLAEKIGVDRLSDTARDFGLGSRLGIDLSGELSGVVPNKKWKKDTIGEDWYLGDTYHYGIGQGFLLTTPLQVNMLTSVIANNGVLYQPRLLKNSQPKIKAENLLAEKNASLIRSGMIASCSSGGVGYALFDFKVKNPKLAIDGKNFMKVATGSADMRQIPVACKTGTAQHGGEDTLPHAWITVFAPAYKPEIIVTVLAESSGEGSVIAAPIAKKILEAYFENSNPE
jgi:penicillin-binding protein 2